MALAKPRKGEDRIETAGDGLGEPEFAGHAVEVDEVEAGYCFHDMMLGRMLELAGDDATVVICSDHGFHPDEQRPHQIPGEPVGPAIEHRDLGMLLMAGPGIKRDVLVHGASLLDITPTILALSGLPVGDDMDGKPLMQALDNPPILQRIPSWDQVEGADGRLDPGLRTDPLASKEAMDQLVALGYIEAPSSDRKKAVESTVRELRYNLARAYMDADRNVDAAPILRELYQAEPDQYRFGVQLAMCYRACGETGALRALVERLTTERRQAAEEAQGELKAFGDQLDRRRADKGDEAKDLSDYELMDEDERQRIKDLNLSARFNVYDMDFLMGCVLTDEGDHEPALAHLRRAGRVERRRPVLHIQIGEALLRLRRWDEAEQAFRQVLAIDPLNPPTATSASPARCCRAGRRRRPPRRRWSVSNCTITTPWPITYSVWRWYVCASSSAPAGRCAPRSR